MGGSDAYVVLELGDLPAICTAVVKAADDNPVWDEQLTLDLPPLVPGAPPPPLLVRIMHKIRVFPDTCGL